MKIKKLIQAMGLAMVLASTVAAAQDKAELSRQFNKAYEEKRYEEAAGFALKAIDVGGNKFRAYYNAACAFALAGKSDEAFKYLQASIDAGLGGASPAEDTDFTSLHSDPRWLPLLASFEKAHPELKVLDVVKNEKLPSAQRHFAGRKAVAEGGSVADQNSLFNQYYANTLQYVGEYDEANKVYGDRPTAEDPIGDMYMRAVDAVPVVLAQAHGRQAVFLNESHGQSQTRAANYALLSGLRADGFNVLAVETLATTPPVPRDASHCSSTTLLDSGLAERGYPLSDSGYYTEDPVFGEIIREALRLGFRLVAYDSYASNGVAAREQDEAENLACVIKQDPKARMVVLAGFSHIAKGKDFWVPGGAMAYRFRELSGIDPLSVDTTTQTSLDPALLHFADDKPAVSYVLQNTAGENYHNGNFDLILYVPAPAHRNDGQPSWLELGGARHRVAVARSQCKDKDPCLVDARRVGEDAKAVAADRCVLSANDEGCTLFLAPGKCQIATFDSSGVEISSRKQEVPGG